MIRQLSSLIIIFVSLTSVHAKAASILILGDSLSAGYNMSADLSWPTMLSKHLSDDDTEYNIVNGSVSGDTTGNGLAKLPGLLLEHQPDYVLIELGANDGLRGFQPPIIERNLSTLITQSQEAGAHVFLMQIRVPPNYGKRYSTMFENIYPKLASEYAIPLIPFFLEEVIIKPEWMMQDGLHPKPEAQPFIAQFVAEALKPHL